MNLKTFNNTYSLCYCFRKKPIMQLGKDGFFHEIGKAKGILVKREHWGEIWYHRPEDYLEWKSHLHGFVKK